MSRVLYLLLIAFVLVIGCKKDECDFNDCEFKAPASEVESVKAYLASQNITDAVQHCSGVFYRIDTVGTGKNPNACSNVVAHYVGRLTNGNIFDQGDLDINLGRLIMGWRIGVPQAREGGSVVLYIPPSLGYGGSPAGTIPPNSILVFNVSLKQVY